jgi:8-oxo-dGTP diphosphatase
MNPAVPRPGLPHRSIVDAMIILVTADNVLLAQRQGTGYADGAWNLPSGKLELGETISHAAIREAREEIGVRIREDALRFVHLLHYRNSLGEARMGVFFQALRWDGEPYNAEPHKCASVQWWPLNELPPATYRYTAEGIRAYVRGVYFSNVGWPEVPGCVVAPGC